MYNYDIVILINSETCPRVSRQIHRGRDYIGKWFGVNEFNGLYTYVMNEFTGNSKLKNIRYSVYEKKCTRKL